MNKITKHCKSTDTHEALKPNKESIGFISVYAVFAYMHHQ